MATALKLDMSGFIAGIFFYIQSKSLLKSGFFWPIPASIVTKYYNIAVKAV